MDNKLILVLLVLLFSGCSVKNNEIPKAKNGIINLSEWDFETDGNVKLDGEWEFYWKKLLKPSDLSNNNVDYSFIDLPSFWTNSEIDSIRNQTSAYATYRLKVVLNKKFTGKILALNYEEQSSAYKIYIDNSQFVEKGKVADNKDDEIPNITGGVGTFEVKNDTIQIIINVSNFHHRVGGITTLPELGSEKNIIKKHFNLKYIDFALAGLLLIMIFYYLSIYFLRKKDKIPLLFSVFCFIVLLRHITTEERILIDIFPGLPYEIYMRIEYLSFFLAIPITIDFLRAFFEKEFKKVIIKISYAIAIGFSIFTLFTPSIIFTHTVNLYQLVFCFSFVYTLSTLIICIIRKRTYSVLIFVSILILILAAINDIAITHNFINSKFITSYGFAAMIFTQSFVLSKKFTNAFKEVEDLSQNLEQKVVNRTVEIEQKKIQLEIKNQEIENQKKVLEDAYKNIEMIGEIGRNITINLSIHDILYSTYENLNNLLDAPVIAFGLIDENGEKLHFYGIENGNYQILTGADYLNDENQLSSWCYRNQNNIFINDIEKEYNTYIKNNVNFINSRKSFIYSPITFKDKRIGVFTVQSFKENMYNKNHVNIVNNFAVYAAVALENAQSFKLLEAQKKQFEKINEQIYSSLVYASRIQSAILPTLDIENHLFIKNFVIFKPRDLVSGDFYWFKNFGRFSVLVAADCTGHGVPGSIMSMLGLSVLNEIVNRRNLTMPDQILNELRVAVKNSLKQNKDNGQSQDGMDIALCSINFETKIMYYAGANSPLWMFRNNELVEFKPDRQPIGVFFNEKPFTSYSIEFNKDDVFYIFSDGFHSQFGGPDFVKYKIKRFKNFLQSIHKKPLEEQKILLENEFEKWIGKNQQTDDVLVIGFKIG